MYKVFLDNTLMHDPRIQELALIDPTVELEENMAGSFSFVIPPNHPRYDDIRSRKSHIQVYQDEDLVFSGVCIEVEVDYYKQKSVKCEGDMTFLNDSIQRPARYQGISIRELLEAYIANHNAQVEEDKRFTVGMVTVTTTGTVYCYSNYESTMQCLKEDLADDYGGYFRIRYDNGIKYIDYLADSLNTNDQVIRLGVNLLNFTSNINSSEIATAIIPLGAKLEEPEEEPNEDSEEGGATVAESTNAVEGLEERLTIESVNDGKDYIFSQTAVNNYGWIFKTVEFDNVTVPANLKRKGEQYLQETQFESIVIEASAIDLHFVDGSTRFKLSDQIRVVSEPHGLNRYFRLTKQTLNLNKPESDTVTLGKEERKSLSATASQVSDAIRQVAEKIVEENRIVNLAKENASQIINGNGKNGHVVLHENENGVVYEILIMDTADVDTATKMWRWNQNGLGFRKRTDISSPWGNYDVAMTMDGSIVADMITTGSLTGININNGNGTFSVDSNGNMSASSANIVGNINSGSTITCGQNFSVDSTGKVVAGNMNVNGGQIRLRAQKGSFTNFQISTDQDQSHVFIAPDRIQVWNGNEYDHTQIVGGHFYSSGLGSMGELRAVVINKGTISAEGSIHALETIDAGGTISTNNNLHADNNVGADGFVRAGTVFRVGSGSGTSGVSGSFKSSDGHTITVKGGIITNIS